MDEVRMVALARRHAKVFSGEIKGYSLMSPISIGFERKKRDGRMGSPILISFRTNGTVEGRCGEAKVTWPMTMFKWDMKVKSDERAVIMAKEREIREKEVRVSKKVKADERAVIEAKEREIREKEVRVSKMEKRATT